MLAFSVPPGYRRSRPPVRPKLDPFTGIIDRILEEVKVTRSLRPQGPEIHTIFQSHYCTLANRAVSDILSIW